MLTYVVCLLTCVIVSAIPTGPVEVVFPSIETFRDGMKSVTFRAFGQDINLRLQPAGEIISKDFSVVDGDGNEILDSEFQIESFKKKLYRDKRMGASLYIDYEDGPLYIYGVVNSKLRIEPQYAVENNKRAHLVFEIKKDKSARFKDKAIPAGIMRNANQKDEQRNDDCLIIEYEFITESTFTDSFPRSSDLRIEPQDAVVTLEQYLGVLILGVQKRMDTLGLDIKVSLKGIIKLTRETESKQAPYIKESVIPGHSECLDASKLLDEMAHYYSNTKIRKLRKIIKKCDIAMLLIGQNLCTVEDGKLNSLVGIAYTGGVCEIQWKFGISQDDDKSQFEREDTVAHESAHLLGCPHDGEGPVESIENSPGSEECYKSGCIMDTEGEKTNPYNFSSCCIENVKNMLTLRQASCLKNGCWDYYENK